MRPTVPSPTQRHGRQGPTAGGGSRRVARGAGVWRGRQVGDSIEGYELLAPVTDGRLGSVWAATVRGRFGYGQRVALEAVLETAFEDPDERFRYLDAAQVSSRVRHANVAQVLDYGVDDDLLYVVTEWVEGDTVRNIFRAARQLGGVPLDLTLRIVADACAGLHAVHELRADNGARRGIVHSHITPSSVLVSIHGSVKLSNFGIGTGDAQNDGAAGGRHTKLSYLSPEQILGHTLDRRSDIFSLGTMLYELVTGQHPFRGEDEQATLRRIVSASPVPPRTLAPWIGRTLEATLLRALRRDPNERFSSAFEVRAALLQALAEIGHVEPEDVGAFVCTVFGERFSNSPVRTLQSLVADDEDSSDAQTVRRPAHAPAAQPANGDALASSGVYPIVDEPAIALDEDAELQGLLRSIAQHSSEAANAVGAGPADVYGIVAEDTAVLARSLARSRRRTTLVVALALLAALTYALVGARTEPEASPAPATVPVAPAIAPPSANARAEAAPATQPSLPKPAEASVRPRTEPSPSVATPRSSADADSARARPSRPSTQVTRPPPRARTVRPRQTSSEAAAERPPESAPSEFRPTEL